MKLLNRLDKAVAFFLVTALLLSSFTFTTFAKDNDGGSTGNTTTESFTYEIDSSSLLGNYDWTDLNGTSVTSNSLADGIYIYESGNYLYTMFVNKQATNNIKVKLLYLTLFAESGILNLIDLYIIFQNNMCINPYLY